MTRVSKTLVLAAIICSTTQPAFSASSSLLFQQRGREGRICGIKYNDINGNGVRDNGEPVMSGWQIQLGPNGLNAVTDDKGSFCFRGLKAGEYKISEVLQAGWTQTAPASGSFLLQLGAGQNVTGLSFGNRKGTPPRPGRICGVKFNDMNGNGIRDNGEPGLGDWAIDIAGTLDAQAVTDKSGSFCFGPLKPGEYKVGEVQQAGWTQTAPASGYYVITLGPSVTNLSFGNHRKTDDRAGSICGVKYNDLNGNGVRDPGEPTLAGWTINLGGIGSGNLVTDKEGRYCFEKLPRGDYSVSETQQSGWTQTAPAGGTYNFNLAPGQNRINIDFGNTRRDPRPGRICGVKFNDLNGNGIRDNGEPGLGDWTIDIAGNLDAQAVTDKSGSFCFGPLKPGEYKVGEVQQAGWTQTAPASGYYVITLGASVTNLAFGNHRKTDDPRPGSICGVKFNDVNGNGVRDNGEAILAGWTINLSDGATMAAVTNEKGAYCFGPLKPGKYTVGEVQQNGWVQTAPSTGTYSFALAAGQSVNNIDFGNQRRIVEACAESLKQWSPLGVGTNGEVWAMVTMGNDVYVGGAFTTAGGAVANHVAKWDGSVWTSLGTGPDNGVNGGVFALAAMGSDLYVGGWFTSAGTTPALNIAKWNGSTWSALGAGLTGSAATEALAVMAGKLYAGGGFWTAGTTPAERIAEWDPSTSTWSALGNNGGMNDRVNSIAVIGNKLYAGGQFSTAGGVSASFIAQWNGTSWAPLGAGTNFRVGGGMGVMNGQLYPGGVFTMAGGNSANYVAKWDVATSTWSPLGTGMNTGVEGFATLGSDLYASGSFWMAGGSAAQRVAKWNGSSWTALGSGMNDGVWRLATIGNDLYAGGIFTTAGGVSANHVAKWSCPK